MRRLIILLLLLLSISPSYAEEQRYSVSTANSPSYGPADAPVTIIEFLDFQ